MSADPLRESTAVRIARLQELAGELDVDGDPGALADDVDRIWRLAGQLRLDLELLAERPQSRRVH